MTESAGNHQNVDFADPKTVILADLMLYRQEDSIPSKILVVGCGKGIEAALLAQHLGTSVTGIDIVVGSDAHTGFFKEEYSKIGASIQQGNGFFRYYRDGYLRMRDSIDAIFLRWCALAVPPCAYFGINAQFMMMGRYIGFDRGFFFWIIEYSFKRFRR